jgi:hypothetical protein
MFANEIRRAVEAAPRVKLPEIRSALYKALAAGQISDADAEVLDTLINTRAALPAPEKPTQRRVGSRPRSSASMERRRSWAASGRLPARLAARFTLAEAAVLTVVAVEVAKRGACALTVGHLAAIAGVSESTVRNALREAEALKLISVDRRRRTAWMNYPNVIQIVSNEWRTWLRLSTGANSYSPRQTESKSGLALTRENSESGPPAAAGSLFRHSQHPAEPKRGFRHSRGGFRDGQS